jgi:hypothetical protein
MSDSLEVEWGQPRGKCHVEGLGRETHGTLTQGHWETIAEHEAEKSQEG